MLGNKMNIQTTWKSLIKSNELKAELKVLLQSLLSEGICCQAWQPEFIPRTHMLEEKNQLLKVALWPPPCHESTSAHTHTDKEIIKSFKCLASFQTNLRYTFEIKLVKSPSKKVWAILEFVNFSTLGLSWFLSRTLQSPPYLWFSSLTRQLLPHNLHAKCLTHHAPEDRNHLVDNSCNLGRPEGVRFQMTKTKTLIEPISASEDLWLFLVLFV